MEFPPPLPNLRNYILTYQQIVAVKVYRKFVVVELNQRGL